MKLYVILSDIHDTHPNKKSLKCKTYHPALICAEEVIKAYQPYGIVYIGDVTDMESLSYFDMDKRKKMEGRRYRKDIDSVNHLLDRHMKLSPKSKVTYLMGNHEERARIYSDYHPEMAELVDYIKDCKLIERNYNIIPYMKTLRIGKALFLHGFDATKFHANKMSMLYPKTLFYGHTHDLQTHSFVSPIDHKEVRVASSLGCLASVNPSWLRGRPNRWVNAFGMMWVKDNGEFQMDIKYVINGETIVNGKVFKG